MAPGTPPIAPLVLDPFLPDDMAVMGHNTTRHAAAGHVRGQQLSSFIDWLLVAGCDACRRQAVLRIDQLAQHWLDRPVSIALMRLRGAVCQKPPAAVRLERRGRSVALIGPGSC